jgi:organic radical activating enzyme
MKVNETFAGFQGEINVGRFAYFLRTAQCSLNCSFCDSNYAKNEWVDMKVEDIVAQAEHFPRIVITGGEPLLQKEEITKLITRLKTVNSDIVIEIETNGTIIPPTNAIWKDVIFNVSPKLKNSGNDYNKRIVPEALGWFVMADNVNFKFVVANEDDVDEANMLIQSFGISKKQVFLMPEGKTRDEQLDRMETVALFAKRYGYNISPRLHILIWDNERGK